MKKIAILGSTGSIGTQTLDVVRQNAGELTVTALAAGHNTALLEKQIRETFGLDGTPIRIIPRERGKDSK